MAGVAGDAGVVAVPKVTVPGPQGAAAGARQETWRPGVAGDTPADERDTEHPPLHLGSSSVIKYLAVSTHPAPSNWLAGPAGCSEFCRGARL
ncbi:unnamed protein product [Boreogadus saida]